LSAFGRYFATASLKTEFPNYLILFAGCVLFHIAGTWSLPLFDRDEPRFAEASREMRQRNDYVVPYFNDRYRFDKPPLTYWAQVASYKIFGENDFAARFPSTIAAALTAVCILGWGSRAGGKRLGWIAAIIFTLSLQTFVHAKAAVADMWLVLFVTLAHWAGYELIQRPTFNPPSQGYGAAGAQRSTSNSEETLHTSGITHQTFRLWWWTFYASLALAFLAKGPIGWTPLLTIGAIGLFDRRLRVARSFKFVRGLLVTFAIISLWGVPALLQTHGEFLRIGIGRHVISRSLGAMEGHGGNSLGVYLLLLPFYFVTIFVSFFPWSIKIPWATSQLCRKRDWIDNYLLSGAAIIFLAFTLVKTKLPHYTLPAFPLLALLLGRLFVSNPGKFFKSCAVVAAGAYVLIALIVPPLVAPLFPAYELFRQSRDYLRPDTEFGSVEFTEPSLVWYFRYQARPFMTLLDRKNVDTFMAKNGPRCAVLPTPVAAQIFPQPSADWKVFSTRGFNMVKGKRVELTLILKER
jgi:4-amino-4-deoxy-L-arabinose transferase-like glycosyltransferase